MAARGRGGFRGGRTQARVPPDGTVRQSQAVTTFGPGATMDLVKQAVLVGGLDFWSWGKDKGLPIIHEPRLRDALAARFEGASRSLSVAEAFRAPPEGDERNPSKFVGVQVLEFPTWFVCQNAKCRALTGRKGLDLVDGRYRHRCSERNRSFGGPTECVPVRFIGACRRGHVEDWPWPAFVHVDDARERCVAPQLVLEEGASGDFAQVVVRCLTCERQMRMNAAQGDRFPCGGERPWLGGEGTQSCDEKLRLLVRTATNSYFSQVVSALSIPDPSHALDEAVASVCDVLATASPATLGAFRTIPKVAGALGGVSDADVLAMIDARRGGAKAVREALRTAELRQFVASKAETPGELPPEDADFFARRIVPDGRLPRGVGAIIVAPKLREVRAQIGFSRIEPMTPDLQGEFDLGVQSASLGLTTDWLPATEIRGEGVLVQLDEERVREWEARPAVVARGKELLAGFDAWAKGFEKAPPFPGARFYLLHSLSHLLCSAISLECGYAASAIRERIYCAPAGDAFPMAAILLSTGTSGTEGTLGGLVEQGRRLRHHLREAFDLGVLCSNDPVCASHSPKGDHAERWLEGAACHGCLFIAECSCEWFNRYLDRALVVPTIGRPRELAFFAERA